MRVERAVNQVKASFLPESINETTYSTKLFAAYSRGLSSLKGHDMHTDSADSTKKAQSFHTTQTVPMSALTDAGVPIASMHPPLRVLYGRGNLSLLQKPCLAIVGSRRASAQGVQDAFWFATEAARAGLVIVSGLAVGIDAAAHRGALSMPEGATIAVLAHGLDQIYPPRHQALSLEILSRGGLLLSEYPDGTPAQPFQFIHRNRIIAGLSRAVCVMEAGHGSGSLITAFNALELGRDVFALPGSIHAPLSAGAHQLIRQGAGLVTSPEDLLLDMGLVVQKPKHPIQRESALRTVGNDPRVGPVVERLDWNGQSASALATALQWTLQDTLVGLLLAENLGLARRLAHGDWVRFQERQ